MSTDFWSLAPKDREDELKRISNIPLRVEKNADLAKMDILKEIFNSNQVEAMKVKVKRILGGNMRQGFNGPKSRILPSESSDDLHVILCTANLYSYTCSTPCIQYKTRNICSHTLAAAADNDELHQFLKHFKVNGMETNLTAAATANISRYSGKKPGVTSRKWKKVQI